jgi:hypothetical protein
MWTQITWGTVWRSKRRDISLTALGKAINGAVHILLCWSFKGEPDPVKEWVLARQISNYTMYQSGSVNTYVVAITAFIVPFRWQKSTVNQG